MGYFYPCFAMKNLPPFTPMETGKKNATFL